MWDTTMVHLEFDEDDIANAQITVLNIIADRILTKVREETKAQKLVSFGEYEKGWEKRGAGMTSLPVSVGKRARWNNLGFRMSYQRSVYVAEVGNTAPHSIYVEYGARPHTPPFDKILRWVEKKTGEHGSDAVVSARKIISLIQKEGLPARFVLTRATLKAVRELRSGL